MFKFGFSQDDSKDDDEGAISGLDWFPASEIKVTPEQIKKEYSIDDFSEITICGARIKIIRSENVVLNLTKGNHENIAKAESEHSDLLPAVYEGGLKVWESSYDLGRYLIEEGTELSGKRILDLGCGAGVLGILASLKGSIVHFQDYNAEVIELVTIPSVLLNLEDRQAVGEKNEFYSGDWASFVDLVSNKYPKEEEKYDIIVSSETIYNPENHEKLYQVFKQRLRENGVGYVAGKTYYFGVGGGMRQFESLVLEDKILNVETVWKSAKGLQREILKLTRNSD